MELAVLCLLHNTSSPLNMKIDTDTDTDNIRYHPDRKDPEIITIKMKLTIKFSLELPFYKKWHNNC